nr:MAG TPA: hypothetical protein [Herelleviridae sp.]
MVQVFSLERYSIATSNQFLQFTEQRSTQKIIRNTTAFPKFQLTK